MLSAQKADAATQFESQYTILTFTILKADLSQDSFVNWDSECQRVFLDSSDKIYRVYIMVGHGSADIHLDKKEWQIFWKNSSEKVRDFLLYQSLGIRPP